MLICNATTPQELREEIVTLILHYAWQERAAAGIQGGKRKMAEAEHAARALETLAGHLKEMELKNVWPSGLRESA